MSRLRACSFEIGANAKERIGLPFSVRVLCVHARQDECTWPLHGSPAIRWHEERGPAHARTRKAAQKMSPFSDITMSPAGDMSSALRQPVPRGRSRQVRGARGG
jgi:hypothetical protein